MRLLFIIVALGAAMLPALGHPKRVSPKSGHISGTAAKQAKPGSGNKSNVRRVTIRRKVHGRWVTTSRLVRVNRRSVVPQTPEPERLREIQQALAEKGYFKGEPNGLWNADSVAALRQFQTERSLPADGKINALSLIGLGLGPKHEGNVALPATDRPTAQATPPQ